MTVFDITKILRERIKQNVGLPTREDAAKVITKLSDSDAKTLLAYVASQLFSEIIDGLEGGNPADLDFFRIVDEEYEKRKVKGCYLCDRSIDGNEQHFNEKTHVCLTCMAKIKSLITFYQVRDDSPP